MDTILEKGKTYTIIYATWMYFTYRWEVIITGYDPVNGLHSFKKVGSRKIHNIQMQDLNKSLVFEGKGLDFVLDSDTDDYWGNGMFNFVSEDPDTLRALIQEKCINPAEHTFKQILCHRPAKPRRKDDDEGLPLFPEGT